MNKRASSKIGKLFRKKNLFILLIAIIFIYSFETVVFHNMKTKKWSKESKLFTDNFLELLMDKKYDELFKKYTAYRGNNIDDFRKEFDSLYHRFGNIKSYEYTGPSSSFAGQFGPVTSFYLNYHITFDSGKSYQGDFNIEIDRRINRPKIGKISAFGVTGNLEEKEIFYIRLIKEHRKEVANTKH